jgi:hypothetical protein
MSTTGRDYGTDERAPSLDEVVRWLTLADSDDMSLLVKRLCSELAEQLIGASVLTVTKALQHAAKTLRQAHVKDSDEPHFDQFALEVEDILARIGALMAVR